VPPSAAEVSQSTRNWRQLRMGMTEGDVEQLLGVPGKVDANQYSTTWYYGYPVGGTVRFGGSSRTVESWREP
jgi:outer membrane protein assembly factor BamE (lipoprotein component of BamABCDE complex)